MMMTMMMDEGYLQGQEEDLALDRLQALLHLEGVYYGGSVQQQQGGGDSPSSGDVVTLNSKGSSSFSNNSISGRYLTMMPESRSKIASWAYDVVDHFGFSRDAVAWMMYYMDRMLLQHSSHDFLLLSVSSLYLAIKLVGKMPCNSNYNGIFPVQVMIHIAKNQFSERQIAETEYRILEGLYWRVHPPTADQFVHALIDRCCSRNSSRNKENHCPHITEYAVHLIELSVLDCFFLQYKPSEVAVAALYCAQDMAMDMGISSSDMMDPALVLRSVLDPSRIAACRTRFSHVVQRQFASVATEHHRQQQKKKHNNKNGQQPRTDSPVSVVLPPPPQDTTSTTTTTTTTTTSSSSTTSSTIVGGDGSSSSSSVTVPSTVMGVTTLDLDGKD